MEDITAEIIDITLDSPTINLNNQDPEINVRVVMNEPLKLSNGANFALNNSFGFGGHNVCIAFSKN